MDLEKAKKAVRSRSWGHCEGCGQVSRTLEVHHRRARGAGGVHGEAAARSNDPRNLLALCRECHAATEHADTWKDCLGKGWRIKQGGADPFTTPALLRTTNGYGWWLLEENLGYRWVGLELNYRLTG